jgi:hypothetical protein
MAEIFETRPYDDFPYLVLPNELIRIRRGSTSPSVRAYVYQKAEMFGDPLPLELAGINIIFKLYNNSNLLVGGGTAKITSFEKAEIEYNWKPFDLKDPGVYYGEFVFQDIDDTRFILPIHKKIQIIVF